MINRLRRQFIVIAMISVTLVVLLMALSINVFNFLSTDQTLGDTLRMICDNQGMITQFPGGRPGQPPRGQLTPETPYSTRYFVLYYSGDGTLDMADMRHIAAVTEEDTGRFLAAALGRGEGMGYREQYKYYVIRAGEDRYMAVFLDCQRELHSMRTFAVISLLVAAACVALVYLLIWFFSKKAIEPTVRSVEKQKQFITDASHELKTPLTVIATSLKVLEMEVGEQKWIGKAQAQTEKLSELVNDLVTLARLDEEKPPARFARFDISGVVTETAESFRDFAAVRGHALEADAAPGLSCCGDEYAIRQLVSVLLDNAVKYSPLGSTVTVRLHKLYSYVRIEIEDAGIGIPKEDYNKIFQRFYRGFHPTVQQSEGSGVGLYLSRKILEEQGGSIMVKPAFRQGSIFVIQLPLDYAVHTSDAAAAPTYSS